MTVNKHPAKSLLILFPNALTDVSHCRAKAHLLTARTPFTAFTLNPLPANTHYSGPTSPQEANECECSSVVYSLVSACAVCQERNYLTYLSFPPRNN
ncbi:uncharacterized protein BT62DRAFT_745982 [Guyanagaster necrorhizus]|uniref:Uncharacterized protein n=1 Tax=Guyanagaster necrorhizus TaxID=856835 RepID=A0A9P8AU06_9AGAR|nr:uncharacterized protein BT62DRAFT_745982 [Guyanagaster necrorhizus MCA 3950]KAG7447978.1 hypothetical protein BT62DRAFT_745982 [Guyanagaster necrorhizus MCA 3950]